MNHRFGTELAVLLCVAFLFGCSDKRVTRGPGDPRSTLQLRFAVPDPAGQLVLPGTGAHLRAIGDAIVTERDVQAVGTHEFEEGDCGINIQFSPSAAATLASATADKAGQTLAIIVDGKLVSAPTLSAKLEGAYVQIRGGFASCDEATALAKSIAP